MPDTQRTATGTAGGRCPFCGREYPKMDVTLPGCRPMSVTMPCTCDAAVRAEADRAEREERGERDAKFMAAWGRTGVPVEFRDVEPDYSASERLSEGKSVYITGKNGRGKTHRACQYMRAFLMDGTGRSNGVMECRRSARFYTAHQITSMIRSTHSHWDVSEEDVFLSLAGVDLLVIDDLGKEDTTDWSAGNIFRVIDDRWKNHKPVIVTSQYTTTELTDRMARADARNVDALKSRLRGWCAGEVLDGPDLRVRGAMTTE